MRKNVTVRILCAVMTAMLFMLATACGNKAAGESSAAAKEEEAKKNMGNPWVDITEAEAQEIIPRLFVAPEGSTSQVWMKCEALGDTEKGISPVVQLSFMLDGMDFTARAQSGVDENADIAGNYVEWSDGPDEVTLSTWGGGNMTGKTCRAETGTGYVDQITWYDVEIGILYSLSVAAEDLDGFDIQAVAESMAPAEEFMPGSFVEEKAGKESFESYEELISYLEKDNGYTYFKLEGYDGELLAVTEETFDDLDGHRASIDATFYGERDGQIRFVGNAFSDGTAYPIRCDGELIYNAGNHEYNSQFMNTTGDALIVKDYIHVDYDESGTPTYSGFRRETNASDSVDIPSDKAEAEKLFGSLVDEMGKKPVMDFTVIE